MNSQKAYFLTATSATALVAATAANAQSFEGFYAGLGLSDFNGFLGDDSDSPDYDISQGTAATVFAGLNWAFDGGVIAGVEFAANGGIASPDYDFDNLWDIKARLGYSFGRLMVYGSAGYSQGTLSDADHDVDYSSSGTNYGVGIEYQVSDNLNVGLDLTKRDLHSEGYYENAEINSVSLRALLRF